MYRFFNIFVNKIVNILIILILILVAFFIGLNTTHAATASKWGTSSSVVTINTLTSTTSYIYENYNSDTIKTFIFEKSNEQFFDNSYTQSQFYQRFNYVVRALNSTTIRVYVQNYELAMDYQGLDPIVGNETRFFFANMTYREIWESKTVFKCGVNAIYSYYIDINYNAMSYTFSNNNPLTDLNFQILDSKTHSIYSPNATPSAFFDMNMNLIDSYNGKFSWIESWNSAVNNQNLWIKSGGSVAGNTTSGFYNSIVPFPELQYVSSGTPGDETPDDNVNGEFPDILDRFEDWLSKIEGNTNSSKGFLEGIGETLGKIGESIGEGLSDLISALNDTLEDFMNFFIDDISKVINAIEDIFNFLEDVFQNILQLILQVLRDIYSFISGPFTGYDSIEDFFESIAFEDNGGISRIISAPLDLIRSLINNDSCSPLLLPIWGKDIEVPSGCILWENATKEINTLWHTLICGAGGYFILTSLFKDVEKIKNPRNSEVSTLDL